MGWHEAYQLGVGAALALFVAQSVTWMSLRLKKMRVARWQRFSRVWLALGILLLAVGAALHFFATSPEAAQARYVTLVGGAVNTVVAAFHQQVVAILLRRQQRR